MWFTKRGSLIILALLLCSCSTTHFIGEEKPVIDELTLVAPYCRIDCLVPNADYYYSDSLSALAEALIVNALDQQKLPVSKTITVVGRSNQEALDRDYQWLKQLSPYDDLENRRLPAAMHAFLSMYSTRYAVLVYSEGFVWSRRVALEEDMRRFESNIWLLVADVRTGRPVYFARSLPEEADPLSGKSIVRRITYMLEEFNAGIQK